MDINIGTAGQNAGQWFGALITIGGVVAGSLGTWLLQASQRRFDAGQRVIDRNSALRKDVYLRATETMTAALTALVNLAQGGDDTWSKARAAFLATLQQIQIVGGEKTVVAASDMNRLFSQAVIPITLAAFKVREKKKMADDAQVLVDRQRMKVESLAGHIKSLSMRVPPWSALPRLEDQLKAESADLETAKQHQQHTASEHIAEAKNFIRDLVPHIGPLNDKALELIDLIRKDLGHTPLDTTTKHAISANAEALRQSVIDLPAAADGSPIGEERH